MIKNGMRPVHPGEVLREDYLKPLQMSANALSKALHVPAGRVNDIVLERRGVTPDTALRLARYFGGDAQSWLNLQQMYDLKVTERQNVQFRASAYNFLNHPLNSFDPNNTGPLSLHFTDSVIDNASTFGHTPIKLGRRVMELSIKYTF